MNKVNSVTALAVHEPTSKNAKHFRESLKGSEAFSRVSVEEAKSEAFSQVYAVVAIPHDIKGDCM